MSEEPSPRVFQVVDEARLRELLGRLGIEMTVSDIAEALKASGLAIVTREPSPGLLVSMALRNDHGLLAPGYFGSPENQVARQRAAISSMRQIHEEVVGTGFYAWEKECSYVGSLIDSVEETRGDPPHLQGDDL